MVFLYAKTVQKARQVAKKRIFFVFALFLFGFPNLKKKMAAGARGHAPPRGPRCGGDARGMPHPGATRGVALPGSARPRGKTPVVDARGRPTSPRPGVVGRRALVLRVTWKMMTTETEISHLTGMRGGVVVLVGASGLEVVGCSSGWAIAEGGGCRWGGGGGGGEGGERERERGECLPS